MSRRQNQKERRRQRILDAAEGLIRESAGTDFLMTTLAERAGFSQATPYNLFGSKGNILFALLNRSVDELFRDAELEAGDSAPFDSVLQAAQVASGAFSADPGYYKPLFRFLTGVTYSEHRPQFLDRALVYWKRALSGVNAAGMLDDTLSRDELARGLVIYFMGALDLWVHGELTEAEFHAQIRFGVAQQLLCIADQTARAGLLYHLREAKRELPRRYTFGAAVSHRGGAGDDAA